jgi:hypothetical protein
MAVTDLSDDIKNLINRYISSVEQMDVLRFLYDNPDSFYSPKRLSQHFKSSPHSIEKRLNELAHHGILTQRTGTIKEFKYEPQSESLKKDLQQLMNVYAERRYSVIDLIYNKTNGRDSQ